MDQEVLERIARNKAAALERMRQRQEAAAAAAAGDAAVGGGEGKEKDEEDGAAADKGGVEEGGKDESVEGGKDKAEEPAPARRTFRKADRCFSRRDPLLILAVSLLSHGASCAASPRGVWMM